MGMCFIKKFYILLVQSLMQALLNFEAPSNMYLISVTLPVSMAPMFWSNIEATQNMRYISVTLPVLQAPIFD